MRNALEASDMLGRTLVLARLMEIHQRYITSVDTPAMPFDAE